MTTIKISPIDKRSLFTIGINLYTKCFHQFVIEAIKDPLVWLLTMFGLLSLGLNIKENGLKDGWYNGESILIILLVVVTVYFVSHI